MRSVIAVCSVSIFAFLACGKDSSKGDKSSLSPEPTNSKKPQDTQKRPPSPEGALNGMRVYGVFTGCVRAINPQDNTSIRTEWGVSSGCSKVIEGKTEEEVRSSISEEVAKSCPDVVFYAGTFGNETYQCSMMPARPEVIISYQKPQVERFSFGMPDCMNGNIPMRKVECVKQTRL